MSTDDRDALLPGTVQTQHIHYYGPPDYTFWLGEDGEVWMPREFTGFQVTYGAAQRATA